ncbi:hypothetical protein BWQ96_07980 [Gracilariopsis chorda]|uniref:Uncharacterized protein n=1 Tax=Gracilariopsis chorda TaxID=448386 RepID=A0A2V3IJL9_9FLOR|nr:hypothetical protein BWQ96_07980 [Gracilariopsis chorda]|eukprot:PXF42261.1 hypothetical protein BWQ96_07980 [Gracilariopsis chorda]
MVLKVMTRAKLSSLPASRVSMSTEDEGDESLRALESDIREFLDLLPEDVANPLSYVKLRREGRLDLISRIMNAGGYIEVSKRMGIPVDESQFVPTPKTFERTTEPLFQAEEQGASIAVGRNLEDKLNTIEDSMRKESRASRDKTRGYVRMDDVPSADELIAQNQQIAPRVVDKQPIEGEDLFLTTPIRLGLLTMASFAALGFGRGSHTVVSVEIISLCRYIAAGLACAHCILGLYVVLILAPEMKRSSSLWFVKVILGGPLAVSQLRSMKSLGDST